MAPLNVVSIFSFFWSIHYKAFMVDDFPEKVARFEELKTSSLVRSRVKRQERPHRARLPNVKPVGGGAPFFEKSLRSGTPHTFYHKHQCSTSIFLINIDARRVGDPSEIFFIN